MNCDYCGGDVTPLGALGNTVHGRCRNCGVDQVVAYQPVPLAPWADDDDHPVSDWKAEVAADETRLGYQDWVEHRLEWMVFS